MSDHNEKVGAPVGMEAFFTRGAANEGLKLPLYLPSGEKSEHWVRILGVDSDAFRAAEAESKRDAFRIAALDSTAEKADAIAESKRSLIASLVVAWSFEQECNRANVVAFFKEAPHIMDAIDVASSKRALFFAARSSDSPPSQSTSSGST